MAGTGQASGVALFELLRKRPVTTRTELVRLSGLSKATVSEAISALMAQGFLHEAGKRQPGRGRSQVVLEFAPRTRLVLGAQFTEHGCHAVLADMRAGPVAYAERPLTGSDPAQFVDDLVACVDELRLHANAPIIGLGVGVPGLVDTTGREVVVSVPHSWQHVPICDLLEERLGLPVVATNRAKAAALGEYWQGTYVGPDAAPASRDNLAYIFVGSGIVAGFVIGGALYLGSGGAAGELGHVTVLPDGPVCGCGNRGCLHMLASESAILRTVRTRLRAQPGAALRGSLPMHSLGMISLPLLIDASNQGDDLVLETVREAASWLGIAIANVVNLMNPSLVVIGGPVAEFGAPFIEQVRTEVRQRALWDALHGVAIVPSALGDNAGTVGAAALYLDHMDVSALLEDAGATPIRRIVPA